MDPERISPRAASALYAALFLFTAAPGRFSAPMYADLGLSNAQVGAVLAAGAVAALVARSAVTVAFDRLGGGGRAARLVLVFGTVGCSLSTLACGAGRVRPLPAWWATASRVASDCSLAPMHTILNAYTIRCLPDKREWGRSRLWGAVTWGLLNAALLGPAIDRFGAAEALAVANLVTGVLLIGVVLALLPGQCGAAGGADEPRPPARSPDALELRPADDTAAPRDAADDAARARAAADARAWRPRGAGRSAPAYAQLLPSGAETDGGADEMGARPLGLPACAAPAGCDVAPVPAHGRARARRDAITRAAAVGRGGGACALCVADGGASLAFFTLMVFFGAGTALVEVRPVHRLGRSAPRRPCPALPGSALACPREQARARGRPSARVRCRLRRRLPAACPRYPRYHPRYHPRYPPPLLFFSRVLSSYTGRRYSARLRLCVECPCS